MIDQEIIKFAKEIDIDAIGFCDINFGDEFVNRLKERKKKGCLSGFEEQDEGVRINVEALLKNAKTIISVALPYRGKEIDKNVPYMSKSAIGIDYHRVMRNKLAKISEFLKLKYGAESIELCDTSPLHDREIAYKCGIGFYGKNSNIINLKYGSFIFLGELVTDIYIERSITLESRCGNCNLCIRACPAGAIEAPYFINAQRCLSYVTQKKGQLTAYEMKLMGTRVYGCDTCQDVCPYNKAAVICPSKEFTEPYYNPVELLNLTNKQFKSTFGVTSSGWRGRGVLLRNLVTAMGNSGKKEYIDMLRKLKEEKLELSYYIDAAIDKLL